MASVLLLLTLLAASGDTWLERVGPAMTGEEKRRYSGLNGDERLGFREAFWRDKLIGEAEYFERSAYIDTAFGSGRTGSGANTDQGRVYLANGAPNSVHRVPSSRIFVETEVWYYDSLPRTGYRSRLQFLFFRKNAGDFRLYSPQLHTLRTLLVPQPGTRLMFPVNDEITPNDIRDRLKFSPAEEEIVEAATGVARGVTGSGNGEILGRAASPSYMLRPARGEETPRVESRLVAHTPPQIRLVQFANAVDVQVRTRAVATVGMAVFERGVKVEQAEIPLGYPKAEPLLYTQRFFLLAGDYSLAIDIDGVRTIVPLHKAAIPDGQVSGEAFEERPGEHRISLTPDPRAADALEALARQAALRAR